MQYLCAKRDLISPSCVGHCAVRAHVFLWRCMCGCKAAAGLFIAQPDDVFICQL